MASAILVIKELCTALCFVYWIVAHYDNIKSILSGNISMAAHLSNEQLIVKFYVILFVCFSAIGYVMFFISPDSYYFNITIAQIVCVILITLLPGKIAFRNAVLSNVSRLLS